MADAKRFELTDDVLENVAGGQIQRTWDNDTGSGTLWVTSKLTTPVVYTYTRYTKVNNTINQLLAEKYGDEDIITLLLRDGLIVAPTKE